MQDLNQQRVYLPISVNGVQRFKVTAEIRKLIARDTRERKRAAIKEAFARHTNWATIAQELRIDRPQAAPVCKVNGSRLTSDEDAIKVI